VETLTRVKPEEEAEVVLLTQEAMEGLVAITKVVAAAVQQVLLE
jgi:hypothetical protein